jgi:hypothetical protein
VTERVRSRTGAPTRWAGPAPDDADPTGGRHVLDQDAGLTPIFTTLRRGAWRRPRPQSARRTLRPVPDPVQQFPGEPWTAPIPVVPAVDHLHGTGGHAHRPAAEPSVSATEATAWWGLPVVPRSGGEHGAYDPDPYGSGPYDAAPHGSAPRSAVPYEPVAYEAVPYQPVAHEPARYEGGRYEPARYEPARYEPTGYEPAPYAPAPDGRAAHDPVPHRPAAPDRLPYQPTAYEPVLYGPPHRFPRHDPRSYEFDPLTDTGRHHRRLAPAGW